jgi:hypothetical protein
VAVAVFAIQIELSVVSSLALLVLRRRKKLAFDPSENIE